MLLNIEHISKRFGGVVAVDDFSMHMDSNEIVGIIGPNGAGKTTIFNLISRVYKSDTGTIELDGINLANVSQEQAARLGIGRTFQNIRLFSTLNVLDNVKISLDYTPRYSLVEALLPTPRKIRGEKSVEQEAIRCLELVELDKYAYDKPANLPYGLQRRLEIARALAMRPKVLMLDEPAAGLNNDECLGLNEFIHVIAEKFQVSLLIIEHRMDVIMNVCKRIYVQDFGRNIAVGAPSDIQTNEDVLAAYLGGIHT